MRPGAIYGSEYAYGAGPGGGITGMPVRGVSDGGAENGNGYDTGDYGSEFTSAAQRFDDAVANSLGESIDVVEGGGSRIENEGRTESV